MAKPTRKQPERRKSATPPAKGAARGTAVRKAQAKPARGVVLRLASGLLALALRNPAVFGGTAAFAVVFGFVAVNALWYQPGHHPSPVLRTRLPLTHPDPARISLTTSSDLADASKVTTFLIEREDEDAPAPEPQPTPQPTPERTASVAPRDTGEEEAAEPSAAPAPAAPIDPAALVGAVQAELAKRGFYDGEADGRLGPKTTAAVKRFERSTGRAKTGVVSQDLFRSLRGPVRKPGLAAATTATPAPRPTSLSAEEGDPVAAAIRAAESQPSTPSSSPSSSLDEAGRPGMVMTIQRGLVNLAYADVTVDGVAGDQTRAAIRDFEKHYRLPETGEPSGAVLKKLKDIGAI